jgi:hypothetical protein
LTLLVALAAGAGMGTGATLAAWGLRMLRDFFAGVLGMKDDEGHATCTRCGSVVHPLCIACTCSVVKGKSHED